MSKGNFFEKDKLFPDFFPRNIKFELFGID